MSIFQALRIRVSYRFLHTITIFTSVFLSLHGIPTAGVFSISNENNKYEIGPLFDLPDSPTVPVGDDGGINLEEFGWKLVVIVILVFLGGVFAGTFGYCINSY